MTDKITLPKIAHPLFVIKDHSNKSWSFRPMLVKEEKLLLIARESADASDILSAIKQVVRNCAVEANFDVEKLPLFELEHAFLKIRGFSVGNEINVSYRDGEDEKVYNFKINLDKVETRVPQVNRTVEVTSASGFVLRYPPASIYGDKSYAASAGHDAFFKLVASCIESVYDGDNVYEAKDFTEADLLEFIDVLDIKSFEKVREFMSNLPSLYYKLSYKNSLGHERTIELTTLSDFFTLR